MNILHLSPYYPSIKAPHAGGVCMGYEIAELSKGNNVYVLCFGSPSQDDKKLESGLNAVKAECIKISRNEKLINVLTHPFTATMFATRRSKLFEQKIREYISKYHIDAVHIEYAAMGQYISVIKNINPDIKCTLVLHDVTYQSFIRQQKEEKQFIKKLFLKWQTGIVRKNEFEYVHDADYVMTFSPKDVELIKKEYGVDAVWINTYFDVDNALFEGERRLIYHKKNNSICFFGQMGRLENHIAALRLVKIVDGLKNVNTYIVGNKPEKELKAAENENIHVTGFVDDPDEILKNCDLAVFPLTVGAGIKIKVLHCMALGLPVITTAIGAEGIDEEGAIIDIVEEDDDFRDEIQKRLLDDEWLKETSKSGLRHIRENYLWDRTIRVFEQVYRT